MDHPYAFIKEGVNGKKVHPEENCKLSSIPAISPELVR